MYKIIDHITNLLYLHDCVIIPDFGAFICNYQSATIDEKNGIILPPAKFVVFNSNIKHNDGLLIDWIATKENIDYRKAQIKVSLFVEELKIRLNQRQKIPFGTLGVFYTDRKFNILFETKNTNFCSDTLGMEAVDVKKATARKTFAIKQKNNGNKLMTTLFFEKSNMMQRLLRFTFMIAILVGALFIMIYALRYPKVEPSTTFVVNTMSIQPSLSQIELLSNEDSLCSYIISPDNEYVVYDPIVDLP